MSRLSSNLIVAAAAVLLIVVLCELLLRNLLPIPTRGYGVNAAYPGSLVRVVSRPDGVRATHRYNNLGFRGADVSVDPGRAARIVAVGDSFTEGVGVAEDDAWPAALARELSRAAEVEVLNLGDGGSGPERYAEIIARVAIALKPAHLIVCLIPSDLRGGPELPADLEIRRDFPTDPFRRDRPPWQKPLVSALPGLTFLLERVGGRWPVQKGSIWERFGERHLELAVARVAGDEEVSDEEARAIVLRRLSGLEPSLVEAARDGEFNPAMVRLALTGSGGHPVTVADMEAPVEEIARRTRRWLDWYARASRANGIEPWVLYYPQAELIVDGPSGPSREPRREGPTAFGDTSVRDLLRGLCRELDIPFIDPTQVLRGHAGEGLYLRYDTHPTATAHALVAAQVARRLEPVLGDRPEAP